MLFLLLFFIQLFLLYLLSRSLTRTFSHLMYRLTKHKTATIYILAFFFLPGTIIHELAHYVMAKLLFVHAGNIRLIPELAGPDVKLGTVAIGRSDPIRRFLIGAAPFLFGVSIILGAVYVVVSRDLLQHTLLLVLTGYIVFEVSNTMFSSKKDMEGAVELFLFIGILTTICYFLGLRIPTNLISEQTDLVLQKAVLFLLVPLLFDAIIILLLKFLHRLFS